MLKTEIHYFPLKPFLSLSNESKTAKCRAEAGNLLQSYSWRGNVR